MYVEWSSIGHPQCKGWEGTHLANDRKEHTVFSFFRNYNNVLLLYFYDYVFLL